MAISFKTLTQNDKTTSRTLLHESIPIPSSILEGTFEEDPNTGRGVNIKTFSHGMFQSIYDFPFASSSANHIFDVTWGYVEADNLDSIIQGQDLQGNVATQKNKKQNIYSQMAQILAGYDINGVVRQFDFDGNHGEGDKIGAAVFMNFSRLLVKDEIKKGSFEIELGTGATFDLPFDSTVTLRDVQATGSYKINSPAGEYGLLFTGSTEAPGDPLGLIFYQAGIVVLPATSRASGGSDEALAFGEWDETLTSKLEVLKEGTIDDFVDGFLHRIQNIQFSNTTELNSTIYFCRANNSEFNYSSNPTYLDGSKIRVKTDPGTREELNLPRSYVTTVGLYSHDNELMAVAKLSEPIRKDPTNELNLRVRLDY